MTSKIFMDESSLHEGDVDQFNIKSSNNRDVLLVEHIRKIAK